MRKIRDVLRLSAAGMSKRQIAVSLGVSATAARHCILRARRAGLGWPLPEGLTPLLYILMANARSFWVLQRRWQAPLAWQQ